MNTTQIRYQQRHVADLAAALRLARAQMSREQGPRAELARHQQQRLEVVVRHAATHSPFYRRQFAEAGALGDGPVQLARLPVLDKSLLIQHFDELVCDPRLRRDELFDWVGRTTRDQLYLDRWRMPCRSSRASTGSLPRSSCRAVCRFSVSPLAAGVDFATGLGAGLGGGGESLVFCLGAGFCASIAGAIRPLAMGLALRATRAQSSASVSSSLSRLPMKMAASTHSVSFPRKRESSNPALIA